MKHAPILEIFLSHAFYTDGRCPDLALDPSAATEATLRNHRCLVRSGPGGARVTAALDAAGSPLLPLPAGTRLVFSLRLLNKDFPLFTDLSGLEQAPSARFSNSALGAAIKGDLALVSAPDAPPRAADVLADVDIVWPGSAGGAPPLATFSVPFQAKRARWAYYCVTDLAAGGGAELTIVDAAPPSAGEALIFSDERQKPLDLSDPVVAHLTRKNPGLRCVRFVSNDPVPCREEPRRSLELRLGADRLSSPLPNPPLRSISRRDLPFAVKPEGGEPEHESLLVQIINYHT